MTVSKQSDGIAPTGAVYSRLVTGLVRHLRVKCSKPGIALMRRIVLTLLLCGVYQAAPGADEKAIVFGYQSGGFAPFVVSKDAAQAPGIMIEALQRIVEPLGYTVVVKEIPRKRMYPRLRAEQIDATPIAMEWVPTPDEFVFSDPAVLLEDLVVSRHEQPVPFSGAASLFGKRIGTHLGYVYPTLDAHFAGAKIVRDDSKTELAMLKKVLAKRSDAAIVERAVALWLIKQQQWQGKFHHSAQAVDSVGYRWMFSRKWAPMMPDVNRGLTRLKESGELDDILAKYR